MMDDRFARGHIQGNHVEAAVHALNFIFLQIVQGYIAQSFLLSFVYPPFGGAEPPPSLGLDLHKDQGVLLLGNDVNLPQPPGPIIPRLDQIPLFLQKLNR